jgi:hypothetical protein
MKVVRLPIEMDAVFVRRAASQMRVPKTLVFAIGMVSVEEPVSSRRDSSCNGLIPNDSGSKIRQLTSERPDCPQQTPFCVVLVL